MSAASDLLSIIQAAPNGAAFVSANTGWDGTTDVCGWTGITCDGNNNVEMVNLAGAGLGGSLHSYFGRITSLKKLWLSSNAFTGTVPTEIVELPNLVQVDLSFNRLTGSLPLFLQSDNLKIQLCGHNQFSGNLPGVALPSSLEEFDIQYNLVTGSLPIFTSAPSLVELDLSNNRFDGYIPDALLTGLPKLERLYLSNNLLTGTIPITMTHEDLLLQEIYLHGNLLSGTLPSELANLEDLDVLFIDDNKLTGTVPEDLCSLNLNDVFFTRPGGGGDVDSQYSDLYGGRRRRRGRKRNLNSHARSLNFQDPTVARDGCSSIACPAGYKSAGGSKDGVFPCEPCESESLNPYIGSNSCFEYRSEQVLQILYEATNGPNWNIGQTWRDPTVPACAREGVFCNQDGDVTKIVLRDKNLQGTLPRGLGFLTHLEVLNLANNQLSGFLPADLHFAPLTRLDISNNQFSGRVPGLLCELEGLNGNGENGDFSCDTVACPVGTWNPDGHAVSGSSKHQCTPCSSSLYLAETQCDGKTSHNGLKILGAIVLVHLGFALLVCAYYSWKKAHEESKEEAVVHSAPSVKVAPKDEWSSGKESPREVWLGSGRTKGKRSGEEEKSTNASSSQSPVRLSEQEFLVGNTGISSRWA